VWRHAGDRMSSAGGDRGDKGGRNTNRLIPQFLIVIQKHNIEKILRTEGAIVRRN
jgi:hypothetical protein